MANITLTRVDNRLMHGQVIVKWTRVADCNRILIVDDALKNDSFMVDIYKMAAPSGINVELMSTQEAGNEYQKNQLGDGKILLLFKTIASASSAYKKGLLFPSLQLGGIPNEPGKIKIVTAVSTSPDEINKIKELHENGVDITAQVIPEESKLNYDEIINRAGI
ncbi:PTS sugar transporter subunit IIB [Lactobacillus sp. ESL0791]|uniref:PTS system mannose/fructose/N-acetylgalactosamine-transporter subunit IIB n=1 Tax=Lactobacillus sp. ESL0791 TaxID=2983234 RepID=UPI0023F6C78D|nr:PTS sugar transporter subunit IIB [Lactobacillus sp. ESL0791]MDF7639797.1 PTS sugar transporter subunit IIB [Lactobacillus sp. ESL0791]